MTAYLNANLHQTDTRLTTQPVLPCTSSDVCRVRPLPPSPLCLLLAPPPAPLNTSPVVSHRAGPGQCVSPSIHTAESAGPLSADMRNDTFTVIGASNVGRH
ncbi:hypothetical protein DPEC_G00223470 [Dallia pectoralis]|uniref:Uncharacterized protein n=1 Tax=Dallia pectoralis TaxID=75939 RepID=A0ACC2G061_DALPE|nr:hypothetical protein DPEC_G00223470 [Dallia pectoralis]